MVTMMLAVGDGDGDGSGGEVGGCYCSRWWWRGGGSNGDGSGVGGGVRWRWRGMKWRCCEGGAAVDGVMTMVKLTADGGWPVAVPEKMKEREWGLGFDNKMT
ncbi:hypothetical protein Tco_1331529 [Tanacetum coccineum]